MNVKDDLEKAKAFIAENGLGYTMVVDEALMVAQAYGVRGLPTVVLIDKAGTIKYQGFGLPERPVIDAVL